MNDWCPLADWTSELGFYGNIFIREIRFRFPGDMLPGHTHNYPHATFVGAGALRVRWRDKENRWTERTYRAPAWFEVPAEAEHWLTGLEPGTVSYCVFAVRNADGTVPETICQEHLCTRIFHERS